MSAEGWQGWDYGGLQEGDFVSVQRSSYACIEKDNGDGTFTVRYTNDDPEDQTIQSGDNMVFRRRFNVGDYVDAIFRWADSGNDGSPYKASIDKVNPDGTYDITWADGDVKARQNIPEEDITIVFRYGIQVGDYVSCRFNKPSSPNHGKYYPGFIAEVNEPGVCYTVDWDDGDDDGKLVGFRDINIITPAPLPFSSFDYVTCVYNNEDSGNNGNKFNATIVSFDRQAATYTIKWDDGDTVDTVKIAEDMELVSRPAYKGGDAVKCKFRSDGGSNGRYFPCTITMIYGGASPTYDVTWNDGDSNDREGHPEEDMFAADTPVFNEGDEVACKYNNPDSGNDGATYDATITGVNGDGTYNVAWADGDSVDTENKIETEIAFRG